MIRVVAGDDLPGFPVEPAKCRNGMIAAIKKDRLCRRGGTWQPGLVLDQLVAAPQVTFEVWQVPTVQSLLQVWERQTIDLDADKGAYYYGRGRVYLLAGEEAQAMRDFMEAGFLGNPDARAYLSAAGVSLE